MHISTISFPVCTVSCMQFQREECSRQPCFVDVNYISRAQFQFLFAREASFFKTGTGWHLQFLCSKTTPGNFHGMCS